MSGRARLLRVLSGQSNEIPVVSPLTDRSFAASAIGKHVAEVTLEDELLAAERSGYDPIIIVDYDWGDYDSALRWAEETLSADEDGLLKCRTLATPNGSWRIVYKELFRSSPEQIEYPLRGSEGYDVLHWYVERIRGCGPGLTEYIRSARRLVGDQGLVCLRLGSPSELLSYNIPFLLSPISLTDRILHYYDYPEQYRAAMEVVFQAERWVVETASAAGCDGFFFGTFGTEILSPRLFVETIRPYAIEICHWIKQHGAYSLYHACGHNRTWLELGFLNQVQPSVLEGFTPPPSGTVMDLRWARSVTDPAICTRGNLDIQLLRDSSPEVVERETRSILEATRGYRHIVGSACAVLHGTPVENVRAMVQAAKTR